MPAIVNECIPFMEPGARPTAHATAAVTGKRFVAISGDRQADGTYSVAPPAAGGRVFGVASWDAAIGQKTVVIRGPGYIVPVRAAAAITAGAEVQVDATGAVVPYVPPNAVAAGTPIPTTPAPVGVCLSAAAINTDARIALY